MRVDIIIVNWNAGQQLCVCLESIMAANTEEFELRRVVVVDNASTDRSLDGLEHLSLPLTIMRNATNRGFAAACNQGAKGSDADYLLFLNPDTRLFSDSLSKPIAFMEQAENQQIGIVGIQLMDEQGQVSRTCSRFPTPQTFFVKMCGLDYIFPKHFSSHFMTDWEHNKNRGVDHVIGAFFLVRQPLFKELNGFDEQFFVYFEDLDFSVRASRLGWRSYYFAEAQAFHKGGGTSEQVKATRLFYSLRSRILYGYKHFNKVIAIVLMMGTLLIEPVTRVVYALYSRSFLQLQETVKGYALLWRSFCQRGF